MRQSDEIQTTNRVPKVWDRVNRSSPNTDESSCITGKKIRHRPYNIESNPNVDNISPGGLHDNYGDSRMSFEPSYQARPTNGDVVGNSFPFMHLRRTTCDTIPKDNATTLSSFPRFNSSSANQTHHGGGPTMPVMHARPSTHITTSGPHNSQAPELQQHYNVTRPFLVSRTISESSLDHSSIPHNRKRTYSASDDETIDVESSNDLTYSPKTFKDNSHGNFVGSPNRDNFSTSTHNSDNTRDVANESVGDRDQYFGNNFSKSPMPAKHTGKIYSNLLMNVVLAHMKENALTIIVLHGL